MVRLNDIKMYVELLIKFAGKKETIAFRSADIVDRKSINATFGLNLAPWVAFAKAYSWVLVYNFA